MVFFHLFSVAYQTPCIQVIPVATEIVRTLIFPAFFTTL